VACLYCAWVFGTQWFNIGSFAGVYASLGTELPAATRVVTTHGAWLFPSLIVAFVASIVGKERFVDDKRSSVMLTCLIALVAQLVGHATMVAHYLPLLDLMRKLG